MLYGENYIYQCPGCTNKISRESLMSGNTFGANYYSDGKRIAPMLIEFPNITKCKNCNSIFWIKNATELGTSDWFDDSNEKKEKIQEASFLTIQEYFEALERKVHQSKAEERDIRVSIWWTFNDRIRHRDEIQKHKKQNVPILFLSDHEKKQWEENTYYLIELLDQGDSNDRIMIAELYRNMEKFDRCMEMIESIEDEDLNWLKEMFGEKCRNKDSFVFKLNSGE
jgi:hypothetical protein